MTLPPTLARLGVAVLLAISQCAAHAEPAKILHVMSYRSDWQWNKDQLQGFLEGLAIADAQVKVVELDAKHSDPGRLRSAARQAAELMDSWKPDLVYTNDDIAQSEFSTRYLNAPTPIVYSGVNKDPADYGFDKSGNVTGVLEREHFLGSLALLRDVLKASKPLPARLRIALVIDDDPTWVGVSARIRQDLLRRNDVEVVEWLQPRTFDEYKSRMLALQDKVDAVGLLGIFRFTGANGKFVDYEEVLRWNVEHSRLPDFSFWDTRVERGTLCAMTVDGIEQGRLAGRMARRILVDKAAPASLAPQPTARGRPMVSLARARKLGIAVDAGVLLAAQALPRFAWER